MPQSSSEPLGAFCKHYRLVKEETYTYINGPSQYFNSTSTLPEPKRVINTSKASTDLVRLFCSGLLADVGSYFRGLIETTTTATVLWAAEEVYRGTAGTSTDTGHKLKILVVDGTPDELVQSKGQLLMAPRRLGSHTIQSTSSLSVRNQDHRPQSLVDVPRTSIGFSVEDAFNFDEDYRDKMIKRLPGFHPGPIEQLPGLHSLCAEFLHIVHPSGGMNAETDLVQVWAKHAMSVLDNTQRISSMTKDEKSASKLDSESNLEQIDQRCFGYLIHGLKADIWVMQYAPGSHPEAKSPTTEIDTPRFVARWIASIRLYNGDGVKQLVEWHIKILQWAVKHHGTPYIACLDNARGLGKYLLSTQKFIVT